MKIALLQRAGTLADIFSERSLMRLESVGEIVRNDGDTSAGQAGKTIRGADIAVTSWGCGPFTPDILDEAPGLRLIVHAAGSVKGIVTDEVWRRGIRVASSAKPLGYAVAETTLGFTIAALKNLFRLSSMMRGRRWISDGDEGDRNIKELSDATVGVVGAGWVGSRYIELLRSFGAEILLCDPYVSAEKAAAMGACKATLHELLGRSDVVSIHAPSLPETKGMIGRDTLALMKKDAVLINTARGSLIDETALYEHMAAGSLKYACLDVYDPEPPAVNHPLRSLRNVIMTPHIAGLAGSRRAIGAHVADEIERFLAEEPLACEVPRDMLHKMA